MAKLDVASIQIVAPADVPLTAASWIASCLREGIAARGIASLALAGGSTPRRVYQELASLPVPWEHVEVFFGDERCVPPSHPDSNFRMAREALLDRVHAPRVFRMQGEREDREAAADYYATLLPKVLDVILLGMGEDGHTASLFPGHDWSRATGRSVIAVSQAPKPPPFRLSVTPDVIWAARRRLVLATGAGKAEQVRRALEGDAEPWTYPVHTVRNATWMLDRDAASLLGK
ncbi:MAG TPA: 6-phosphogluconolactonase [Polyangiaceae bacterium]|jgi:6-phosphogluconolactonase